MLLASFSKGARGTEKRVVKASIITMRTIAYQFKAACQAGLILSGESEKEPEWIGTDEQFKEFERLKKEYEDC